MLVLLETSVLLGETFGKPLPPARKKKRSEMSKIKKKINRIFGKYSGIFRTPDWFSYLGSCHNLQLQQRKWGYHSCLEEKLPLPVYVWYR